MNKIERLFYERIMKNLKVGDTIGEGNTKIPIIEIVECRNGCPVFNDTKPRYSCAKKCFVLKKPSRLENKYNCICGDGIFTIVNGKEIYTKKERKGIVEVKGFRE